MELAPNKLLILGAALSAIAALLHLACIAVGAPMYRFLGAGERMAQLASTGHWYPTFMATVVATILTVFALYALSGAGVILRLPLTRLALMAITGIYLLRGVGFPLLMRYFPDNSLSFWIVSSTICLAFGAVYLLGLRQVWARL